MQLSEKLSILRKRKKLSVKQLSVMTGISPTTLLNYESGKTFPTAENVLKLSVALEVTCQELIQLEEKEKYDKGIDYTKYAEELGFIEKHSNLSFD